MKQTESRRATRLSDQIARELAEMLARDMADPRLELVTISGVRLNPDMKVARVLYTMAGDAKRQDDAAKAFEQGKGRLRALLGKRLRMKFLPELRFERDAFLEDMVYAHPEG